MRRSRVYVLVVGLVVALGASAQQPTPGVPRVACVFPAGARQGTTVRLTINGQFLQATTALAVSGEGVTARVVNRTRPLNQKEINDLRQKLQDLQKEKRTPELQQQIQEVVKKLATVNRKANPAMVETAEVEVTVAPDAAPGPREIRLAAPLGLSNPLAFRVTTFEEVVEPQPEPTVDNRFAPRLQRAAGKPDPAERPEPTLAVPGVVNGRILPGEVDRYRFRARKGQQLVAAVEARALTPYIADAVPGWFQATLAVYDARKREVAFCDDYRFHPDPVLAFRVPEDGEYVLEIKDALYRGREDFVYRVTLGEHPFVTGVFPLGGRAGEPLTLHLEGWNLPADQIEVDASRLTPGLHSVPVQGPAGVSHTVPFALDSLPEGREQEPNDTPATAQAVTLPVVVNGRIDRPGDRDVFTFTGKAGATVVAEVLARRLESPLDSTLRLTDAAGRTVAFNDDWEDPAAGLLTHHADSRLTATLPADGAYHVTITDAQNGGSSAHAYRLRLGSPRPDFALRVVPSTLSARSGQSVAFKVHALRRDGFAGDIRLALKDAPAGFSLSGARIPAGQDAVRLTLTVPSTAPDGPVGLSLVGRAGEGAEAVERPVLAADDMLQAFYIHHLVPAKQLTVAVLGRGLARPVARATDAAALKVDGTLPIPAGGSSPPLRFETPRWAKGDLVRLELSEPPPGISLGKVAADPTSGVLTAQVYADAAKVKVGQQGNLIVNVFVNRANAAATATPAKAAAQQRIPVGTLPALPYEVVAPPAKK